MRMKHGLQGRLRQWQHGPGQICINRTLIKQRLLVEFSCEFPHHTSFEVYLLVRSFVLCDKWLLQQQNSTILQDSALRGLLSFTYSLSSSTASSVLNVKKNLSRTLGIKGYTSQAGKAQPVGCSVAHACSSVVSPCVGVVDSYIRVEGSCCRIPL